MRPKEMEDLAAFSAREVKRVGAEEREKDVYSSAEGQWESKVRSKVIPASFLKVEERTLVGAKDRRPVPINSRLNVVVRSPAPFGLGRNGCWPSRGSQLPRALPIHFFAMLPPERPQKGSTQHL